MKKNVCPRCGDVLKYNHLETIFSLSGAVVFNCKKCKAVIYEGRQIAKAHHS